MCKDHKNSLVDRLAHKLAMMIIKAELLQQKKEIENEMPLLLKWISSSNRILVGILKFHTKSKSWFGLLSSAYLIVQRSNLLQLQMIYLKCPYDFQEKISSYVQEK